MFKYTSGATLSLTLVAALIAACRSDNGRKDTALAADTSLTKQLASADTSVQPQLRDVPPNRAAPAPAAPAPAAAPRTTARRAPARTTETRTATTTTTTTQTKSGNIETRGAAAAAPGGGAVGMIPAGATLALSSTSRVCTNTNKVGDHVEATVSDPVSGSNGAVIPAGAVVALTVTQLKRSENANDPIVMEFAVNSVSFGGHTYPLNASVESATVDRVRDQPASKDVQKVAIGAAVGAIAGRIIGKSTKGTVIGGAAGAAAGAAAASATANYQGCVPSGGRIVVKLNTATQVRA